MGFPAQASRVSSPASSRALRFGRGRSMIRPRATTMSSVRSALDMVVKGGYRIDKPQVKKMPEVERELDNFL